MYASDSQNVRARSTTPPRRVIGSWPGAAASVSPSQARARRQARPSLPHRASVELEQEIRKAFEVFDADGTGEVDYYELKGAMRALGLPVKKAEVLAAMRDQGCLESGRVDFHAFAAILRQKFEEQDPLDAMLQSFRLFDTEGCGRISFRDLKRVAQDVGEELVDCELRCMIDSFDRNGDREIDEEEFVRIFAPTSLR